jgi:hypothetical protein
VTRSRILATAAILLAALALAGCGGGGDTGGYGPEGRTQSDSPVERPLPAELEASVEAEAAAFLEREGTAVEGSLRPFLGAKMATWVEAGATICRAGSETPSIADPDRYPFACIVRARAESDGLALGIVLGFVGTELDDEDCWRAANERIAVTSARPELLSRREAQRPVNQIAACA